MKLAPNVTATKEKGWCSFCGRGRAKPVVIVMVLGKTKLLGTCGTVDRTFESRTGMCLRCVAAIAEVAA